MKTMERVFVVALIFVVVIGLFVAQAAYHYTMQIKKLAVVDSMVVGETHYADTRPFIKSVALDTGTTGSNYDTLIIVISTANGTAAYDTAEVALH